MGQLFRITEDGDPLNDTWSNPGRRHNLIVTGRVDEPMEEEYHRLWLRCTRCSQVRKVWHRSSLVVDGREWGCPRVPPLYRLRRWLQGQTIPTWSVNEPPPWWAAS